MMPLFLTRHGGIGQIPCPECNRPLLLALARRGRWLVGCVSGFRVRPGQQAMLVCPSLECDHVEPVMITADPDDAVAFNPWSAASAFRQAQGETDQTLAEMWLAVISLRDRFRETGDPRLPSLFRFWRRMHRARHHAVRTLLSQAYVQGVEILCQGKDWSLQGRVKDLIERGLLIEPHSTGEAIYVSVGTLVCAAAILPDESQPGAPEEAGNLPGRFAVVAGHSVELVSVSPSDICQVATDDPEVAAALHLWSTHGQRFRGEVPAALVERVYRVVRYGHIQGYRLHIVAQTAYGKVRAESRDLDAARALQMNRPAPGSGRSLRWWKEYRLDQIRLESVEIPDRLRPGIRLRQIR